MRISRLGLVGRVVLALLAVFAFGVVAATAAQAEKAARWTVEGKILGAGETKEITAKADGAITLSVPNAATTITCTETKVAAGAKLIGSAEGEPGTTESVNEFSKCTVKGNGSACKEVEEPIVTKPTIAELVLSANKSTILVEFKPKEGESFTTIKFKEGCTEKKVEVRGGVVGSVYTDPEITGKEAELVLASNTDLLTSWLIKFPDAAEKIWLVKGGVGSEVAAPTLKYGTNAATLEGAVLISLKNGGIYGAEVA